MDVQNKLRWGFLNEILFLKIKCFYIIFIKIFFTPNWKFFL